MNTAFAVCIAALLAIVLFSLLWVYQKRTGDAGIVDVAWGSSVGLLSAFFCWTSLQGDLGRRWIIATLAMAWAIRLSWHIHQRLKKHVDGRYTELEAGWGEEKDWRMFRFFMFQAVASVMFALPMLLAALNPNPIGLTDYLGVTIWVIAICGEWLADYQLNQFRNNPENKGQVCKQGLWRFSRHPNYFFEWIHWWAYVFFAISFSLGWLSLLAPALMLFFILKVTGIPPTEQQALKSRGERYREYQRTTNAFFPWFPKSLTTTQTEPKSTIAGERT